MNASPPAAPGGAWIEAPSLFDGFDDVCVATLHAPDASAPEPTPAPHPTDQRLGRRFERQVLTLLAAQPDLELLATNLVIQGETRTLGELDAIVYNRREQCHEHWEITLKFYLGLSMEHWPGPDPRDSFAQRRARLRDHQFPLDQTPACRAQLRARGIPGIDRRRLFSRGRLYYPASGQLDMPEGAHPAHSRGRWWHTAELPADMTWTVIQKPQWLCLSPMSNKSTNRLATPQLLDYVQQSRSPVMVDAWCPQTATATPGFVVSDSWLLDAQSHHCNT